MENGKPQTAQGTATGQGGGQGTATLERPTPRERDESRRTDRGRVVIRCNERWRGWLQRLALHCDLAAGDVMGQATSRFAEQVGFFEPTPPRLPRLRLNRPTRQLREGRPDR